MPDDPKSVADASEPPPERKSGAVALVLLFGLIAVLALGAAAYFWRGQQAANAQRAAWEAQSKRVERQFRDLKGGVDAIVAGVVESLVGVRQLPLETAETIFTSVEDSVEKLAAKSDNDRDIKRSQAAMYMQFADAYLRLGDPRRAVVNARKGTELFRVLAAQYPADTTLQGNIGLGLAKVGEALRAGGDIVEARVAYRKSLEIARGLTEKDLSNRQWRIDFVLALWALASAGDAPRENYTEALKALKYLKLQGALTPAQEEWIPLIEDEITKLK